MKVYVTRTDKKIVSITLDAHGALQVCAHRKLPLEKVKQIVENNRDWIDRQVAAAAPAVRKPANSQSNDVAEMFCGKKCLLCGQLHTVRPTVENKCYLENNCIYVPEKLFAERTSRLRALKTYLKKLSTQFVSGEISRFGSQAALCPTRIEFKNLGASWVKCTRPSERIITLDFRICQLSAKLQHYLIVHAFSHFTNEGHDSAFWNTVSNYMPHYQNCVEELNKFAFLKEI